MLNKESLWLQRMGSRLLREQAGALSGLASQGLTSDDEGYYTAVDQALDAHCIGNEVNLRTMPYRDAAALHEELTSRVRQKSAGQQSLDIVEKTALESLAALLGVPAVVEHRAVLRARFKSGTITYQGDFGAFKKSLRYGVSLEDVWHASTHISNVQVLALEYERIGQAGGDLGLCRVEGEVEFELARCLDDTDLGLDELLSNLRASIGHAWQPVPVQRVNLEDIEVVSHVMR